MSLVILLFMSFFFIDRLIISRPLVFLCGPYTDLKNIDPRDRRVIMRKWINSKWVSSDVKTSGEKIHAYPIIVDAILDGSTLKTKNLKANLSEEILAQVAYRTYIFLDTMSTSYEFGEFTNYALGENSVQVFLDDEYGSRVNCPVNEYLKISVENRLTTYKAEYNGKGYVFFPNDKVPQKIVTAIAKDSPLLRSYISTFEIRFLTSRGTKSLGLGEFVYEETNIGFDFSASPKTWFYFMSLVQSKYSYLDLAGISSPSDLTFVEFLQAVKKELFLSFCGLDKTSNKIKAWLASSRVGINCPLFGPEFFYHCAILLGLIKNSMGPGSGGVSYVSILPTLPIATLNDLSSYSHKLLGVQKFLERREEIIKFGVVSKTLVIKGKKRNIICYSPSKFGRDLRAAHETVVREFLSFLPTSPASFAYKEGCNTMECLRAHEGNTEFAKYDISKYFESIALGATLNKILNLISLNREEKSFLPRFSSETLKKNIKGLLKPLFFSGRLPIGYVSSPKISDFYLYVLDEEMRKIDGVTYTRYADDILLSSKEKNLLDHACQVLIEKLQMEGLKINEAKFLRKSLNNVNDSIQFLGINLIKRQCGFSYSISRKYLVQTSKQVQRALQASEEKKLKVRGRIAYIRFISEDSYSRLKKMVVKKLGDIPSGFGL